jgi:hypothetical protein
MENLNDAPLMFIECYCSFVQYLLAIELFTVMIVFHCERRQLEHYVVFYSERRDVFLFYVDEIID